MFLLRQGKEIVEKRCKAQTTVELEERGEIWEFAISVGGLKSRIRPRPGKTPGIAIIQYPQMSASFLDAGGYYFSERKTGEFVGVFEPVKGGFVIDSGLRVSNKRLLPYNQLDHAGIT